MEEVLNGADTYLVHIQSKERKLAELLNTTPLGFRVKGRFYANNLPCA